MTETVEKHHQGTDVSPAPAVYISKYIEKKLT